MRVFHSGREAKEYLIARIVLAAKSEGVALSETERKMMYFSETAWTLPDIWEVNARFERDYDTATYEAKIGALAAKARARAAGAGELGDWNEAVRVLGREDHYLLVLLGGTAGTSTSWLKDRVKLIGTALLIVAAIVAGILFLASRR